MDILFRHLSRPFLRLTGCLFRSCVAGLLLGVLCFAGLAAWQFLADPQSGPPTRTALCQALGMDPGPEQRCYQDDSDLQDLLEAAFPLQTTRVEQVHERLGPYLKETRSAFGGGVRETYAVERGIVPVLSIPAFFEYDAAGRLERIEVFDGFVD